MPALVRRISRTLSSYALWGVLTLILLLLLVYPIILTVRGAIVDRADGHTQYTFSHIALALSDPSIRECLANSMLMAATTTTICLLIAVPLAILGVKYLYPLKSV